MDLAYRYVVVCRLVPANFLPAIGRTLPLSIESDLAIICIFSVNNACLLLNKKINPIGYKYELSLNNDVKG